MTKHSYHEDELEHVPAVMLGGPFDGRRYRMPVMPGMGVPHGTSMPLTQPHETSAHARYERAGDAPIGGYYVYFFVDIVEPDGHAQLAVDAHQEQA